MEQIVRFAMKHIARFYSGTDCKVRSWNML